MSEAEPGSGDNDPSAAEPQGGPRDFSAVQGFQLVGAEDRNDDPSWRDALRLELEARAARFHQAVDSAIMLSNDGLIRWLGDPVARLSAGPDALNPGALILADPSLPEAARDLVRARVELWIAATTRRILGPLFALEALQEGPESIRDLARKVGRSLGILEREPIRAEIRALSQNDRAELRKQGVRFGAYYLFVPALIKPAARTLALHLWSLRAPGDAGELLRTLAPIAASGRTSLALDAQISHEGYRVAGYRQCGDRAVRVDIIERLGGMIRGVIAGEPPGGAPEGPRRPDNRPPFRGFTVSGQMTSLTGCSGESFASILRSMGFRPVEMKRSEFLAAAGSRERSAAEASDPAPTPEMSETAAASEEAAAEEAEAGDPPPAQDLGETAAASEGAPVDEAEAGDPPPAQDMNEAAVASEEAPVDEAEAGDPPPAQDMNEAAVASEEAPVDEAEAGDPPPAQDLGEAPVSEETAPLDGAAVGALSGAAADPEADGARPSSQGSAPGGAAAGDAETIVVWRPDHRRPPPNRRPARRDSSRSATPRRPEAGDQGPGRPAETERVETRRPDAGKAGRRHPPGVEQPGPDAGKKHRQRASDRDIRANSAAGARPRAKADPDSPFAKLLELRSLLESQANKRP